MLDKDAVCGFAIESFGGTLVDGDYVFPKGKTGKILPARTLPFMPSPSLVEMRVSVAGAILAKMPVEITHMQDQSTGDILLGLGTPDATELAATLDKQIGKAVSFGFYKIP